MKSLHGSFFPREAYAETDSYSLLPLRFTELDESRYFLSSLGGDYIVLPRDKLLDLVEHRLDPSDPLLRDLEARHLVHRGNVEVHRELLSAQYRTRQSLLPEYTSLHIFVVTLRCDNSCHYCQVSRVSEDRVAFDMSPETADRSIQLMFRSPSRAIKVEFQGGESLLNFPLIRRIVLRTKELKGDRSVEFVVATNLAPLTIEMLEFFAEHHVMISTSIDGPAKLHNQNRPRPGMDAYERAVDGIRRCREILGPESVSALMTCTAASLEQPEEIVDEYVRLGFREVFLRSISPYGFAVKTATRIGYETEQFLEFFRRGVTRVLDHAAQGVEIREVFSAIILRRLLTSFPTGYVDLQSPSGIGTGVIVYNYDGDVYASDESRMLAEMGDKSFRLGNVHGNSWEELFTQSSLLPTLHKTMTEGLPGCCDCAFQPYCGSEPIRHHVAQGDVVGHRPTSSFCRKHIEVFRYLVRLMEDSPLASKILRKWAAWN